MTLVAADAKRIEDVRQAFRKLLSEPDIELTKNELFGGDTNRTHWTRSLMDRCVARGLVVKEQAYGRGKAYYRVADVAVLAPYVEDDALLSTLIWPKSSGLVPDDEMFEADVEPPSEPTNRVPSSAEAVEAIKWIENTATVEENITIEETIRANLKISYAVLQNLAYMREKLEAVETALSELREVWK